MDSNASKLVCIYLWCFGWLWQLPKVLEGHLSWIYSVAISTDGAKIVSGSRDMAVGVWSVETGEVQCGLLVCLLDA